MTALLAAAGIAAAAAGLYAVWRAIWGYPDPSAPRVLAYHKTVRFKLGGTWVSPRRFERQIDALLGSGSRFIGETEFLLTLEGRRPGSAGEVLLTFDDGYEDFARHAAPVLEARGIPALIFLVSGYAGRRNEWELPAPGRGARHMDWETVRGLCERGFSFGSHTVTHRPLTRLAPREAAAELARSRRQIAEQTGRPVRSLSYPFGMADRRLARAAREAGYRAAFVLAPPRGEKGADPFLLRRDGVWVIDTPWTIRTKLSRRGLFWLEDCKERAISACSVLTPLATGAWRTGGSPDGGGGEDAAG
ncbi:MAG: polysaccharide deacetylase family protein [Candidatus Krumholzibacteria bacterium]|nr:polysaccharide deacetylase family protein [Candidatus Krumholzibacteria bacterium]